MTKEEAIKRFETLLLHVDTDCVMGMETTEAINMAIKALKQPEPCEDAVSREEVLNCLEWQYPDKTPRTKIMELPSVTPKQRTGKWIYKDDLKQHFCSECGYPSLTYDDIYIYDMDLPNFCEECGAKMEVTE